MNVILWLTMLLFTVLTWLITPSLPLLTVLVVLIAVPTGSWALLFLQRKQFALAVTAPSVAAKRQPFTLETQLLRKGKPVVRRHTICLRVENAVTSEVIRKRLTGSDSWELKSLWCGSLSFHTDAIYVYDRFGILPVRLPLHIKKRVTVMPELFPVEVQEVFCYHSSPEQTEYVPGQKGFDHSETMQIREYIPGDSLKQIHWKLTGKTGRLMVRDPSQPVDRSLTVFLDCCHEPSAVLADALVTAVISVCQGLSEAGFPFHLAWNQDNTIRTEQILTPEQIPQAAAALLKANHGTDVPAGYVLYEKETVPDGTLLYFGIQQPENMQAQVFLCGHDAELATFTPMNMQEVLRRLTWS